MSDYSPQDFPPTWAAQKIAFGPGPWQTEPDRVEWTDDLTGYPCVVMRSTMGHLCGYVGVSNGHPAFRLEEEALEVLGVSAHGGLTFADYRGLSSPLWWIGFDCGHYGDFVPQIGALLGQDGPGSDDPNTYRTIDYVEKQCTDLAMQLFRL